MQLGILLWINIVVYQYYCESFSRIIWINLPINCYCVIFLIQWFFWCFTIRLYLVYCIKFHWNPCWVLIQTWTNSFFPASVNNSLNLVRGSDAKISILPNWCCWSKNCKVVRLINWLNPSSQAVSQTAEENTCKRGFKETGEELKDMGMIFGLTVTSEMTFTRCKGKHLPYNWITKGYERCQCDKLVFLLWMSLQHPDFGSKQVNTVGALLAFLLYV